MNDCPVKEPDLTEIETDLPDDIPSSETDDDNEELPSVETPVPDDAYL